VRSAARLVLLLGAVAAAGELLTPGEQLLAELAAARAAGDAARAVPLLRELVALHEWPASPAEGERLFQAAVDATRDPLPAIRSEALASLGAIGDPKAGDVVAEFLKEKAADATEEGVVIAASRAAGRLRIASLIPPLLRLAQESRNAVVAEQALFALGEFAASGDSTRKNVIDRILPLAQALSRQRERWIRLRAPALRCLQQVTGKRLNSLQQFADWWKWARTQREPFAGSPG